MEVSEEKEFENVYISLKGIALEYYFFSILPYAKFKIVDRSEVPEDANVLHGRFVLAIKEPETRQQKFKARYVIQGHRDPEKHAMVKEAPQFSDTQLGYS